MIRHNYVLFNVKSRTCVEKQPLVQRYKEAICGVEQQGTRG